MNNTSFIASKIDHTSLGSGATKADIRQLCQEAIEYGFASVCVNPFWVSLCSELLANAQVAVCTVVGFPLGANLPEVKASEAAIAISQGADEIDMVLNIGLLCSGDLTGVEADIRAVRDATLGKGLKVILETAQLTNAQIVQACQICMELNVDFVNTSTDFSSSGGAIVGVVMLMNWEVGKSMGIKASGGIRTYTDAMHMLEAGATRLGCSAGVAIVEDACKCLG